ncbi:glucose-6-phosphate isomerase [Arenimonas caeni]|jgi:glucose-6-phosphate isomerase|uniref:glucose-6-phosphate isomerase n=1 Tax=Arenimonas caeni TaxID=2058085 RepID=UPI002A35C2AA|nr:glucose-6-phosphate isomerase [Arenimonas caeni]MDY0021927.1 glucose-6-phosphate isomerase [Arenimonas caeni]
MARPPIPADSETWSLLRAHAARLADRPLARLMADDPARGRDFGLRMGSLHACFARQRYDRAAREALFALAAPLPAAFRRLFDGETVNVSEGRPALHTALRSDLGQGAVAAAARAEALAARERMAGLVAGLEQSGITDIVNIGIGGSDLGPRLAVQSLAEFDRGRFRTHFLFNADASGVQRLLPHLDPERTAVLLVSKSFGTQETLLNGSILKDWLAGRGRLYAVTAAVDKAVAFGVPGSQVLPMWDWVGGRFSLWSPVGLCIALALGMANFDELLAGAAEMDRHVLESPPGRNLAAWHALTMAWNRDVLGLGTHAVMPYDERLDLLPDYLQQLVMESLGKTVRSDDTASPVPTVPVLWGATGTSSQHSFFQALHQGSDLVPADFIGVVRPAHGYPGSHDVVLANLLAQAEALANGSPGDAPQRHYDGGRPNTMLLLDELTPRSLGSLLALYEHSVYALSVVWGINAFDQWGVELGKRLASGLLPVLSGRGSADDIADPVTRALVTEILARR